MSIGISALSAYVPERVVTNDELAERVDTSDEWIFSHTGIRERRIAEPGTAASDLATEAAQRVLEARGVTADELDLIIVATSSPDYSPFPATASIVQEKLGAADIGAFDLQAGCTGFAYGLETAASFVAGGRHERVLVIGSEVLTAITNWNDRNTCVLFGDGAGAVIVEAEAEGVPVHAVEDSWLRSKGSGAQALIRRAGGSREPFDPQKHTEADFAIAMNGKEVYLFAVDALVQCVGALSERAGIAVQEVDWIVPHQANARIIEAAAKRLKLPVERFFMNMDRFANTSAASIPIALDEMQSMDLLKPGHRVITIGFGAGLTYGGNMIRW
ncbi:MAG: beta-ketoacyl-ACP synthase III [Spirochaetales bacterium]